MAIKLDDIEFSIWQGTIQLPRRKLDTFSRLGGWKVNIQPLGFQAENSQCVAYFKSDDAELDQQKQKISDHIKSFDTLMNDKVLNQVPLTWTDGVTTIANVYLLDYTYAIKAVEIGNARLLVTYNMTLRAEATENKYTNILGEGA
jgi:hypothetical protein